MIILFREELENVLKRGRKWNENDDSAGVLFYFGTMTASCTIATRETP